jgi:hypothetical protein
VAAPGHPTIGQPGRHLSRDQTRHGRRGANRQHGIAPRAAEVRETTDDLLMPPLGNTLLSVNRKESPTVNVNLHLTDNTQLRAQGFVDHGELFAEVCWDVPTPGSRLGQGALWGTPTMLRQLAELATQAAIRAEEEAAWQAHTANVAAERGRVA